MTPLLRDLMNALAWDLRHEAEAASPVRRASAEALEALEAADAREQFAFNCADDAEREVLARRWLKAWRA